MNELMQKGLVVQRKPGGVPRRKYYLDEGKGVPIQSLWEDIPNLQGASAEREGNPHYVCIVLPGCAQGGLHDVAVIGTCAVWFARP